MQSASNSPSFWTTLQFVLSQVWTATGGWFLLVLLTQTTISLSSIINTFTFKEVIDAANGQATLFNLSVFGVILVRLIYELIRKALEGWSSYLILISGAKQVLFLNKSFVEKVATLDLATFENPHTVGLIQRAFSRFQFQYSLYVSAVIGLTSTSIELLLSVGIFVLATPWLALVIVIANLIPILVRSRLSNSVFNIYRADDETKRRFGYSYDILTERETLPEVKVNQAFNYFKHRILAIYRQFTSNQLAIEKKYQVFNTVAEVLPIIALFFYSVVISQKLLNQQISTGTFIFLFTNVFVFAAALQRFGMHLGNMYADSHFMGEIKEFFDLKPQLTFIPPSVTFDSQVLKQPAITLDHVSFQYPETPQPLFENLCLEIPYGQNVALIGENGAGKTTLVKLLLRMYDPTSGRILINGIDLKALPETAVYALYSTLFQAYGRFHLTVRENFKMVNPDLSDEEMVRFLKMAKAWEFIKETNTKLNQQLGPTYTNGIDLSGGQWQRLAIARAYAKKAPILILDEPTSAVDAKAEMEIFDRLNTRMKKNTLIFISHRFSTIKDAERIVVLDKGKIVEDGNHHQLMAQNGKYATLYSLQAQRYQRK